MLGVETWQSWHHGQVLLGGWQLAWHGGHGGHCSGLGRGQHLGAEEASQWALTLVTRGHCSMAGTWTHAWDHTGG